MGEESTSNSKADDNNNAAKTDGSYETPVILNVYDLTPANQYSVWLGFGIFHSGIEGKNKRFDLFGEFHFLKSCFFSPYVLDSNIDFVVSLILLAVVRI